MQNKQHFTKWVCGMALLSLTAACFNVNPDIDRATQEQTWKKSDFSGSWYYTSTVIKSAPNALLYEGDSDFIITERLQWEVTENALIGWRDYETAEGTEDAALQGGDDTFKGQPVAIYTIEDHYDIRRTYDPITGEEGNVIEKNHERPWYEREYMDLAFTGNAAPNHNFRLNPEMYGISATMEWVQEDDIADPNNARFEFDEGYFEYVSRMSIEPSIGAILGFFGRDHYYDFAATVVDVRHSFKRVPDSDYVPLNMPDNVPLVDAEGNEVRDENGIAETVQVNDRFGFFTTWHRQVWDPARGFTYAGEKNYALRFNIWEKSRNDDGSIIPIEDRTPKPIIYYTNQRHPKQLLPAAMRVGAEWNDNFKDMVFHAQPGKWDSKDDVPDMFIVRENTCNPANVKNAFDALNGGIKAQVQAIASQKLANDETNYLDAAGDTYAAFDGTPDSVIARYEWANDAGNDASFTVRQDLETQALADLERICTVMENLTHPSRTILATDRFTYERIGDLRYNFINGIVEKASAPWLGVATILGDPETGEMVSGVANIGLSAIDRSAYVANEAIMSLEGEIDLNDIYHGYDVSAYVDEKLRDSRELITKKAGQGAQNRIESRLERLRGPDGQQQLRDVAPNFEKSRLEKLAGTHIEDMLVSDYDLMAHARVTPDEIDAMDGDTMEALMAEASPFRERETLDWRSRVRRYDAMAEVGIDTNAFLDDFAFGAAVKYRDLNRRERFEKIREDLYVSTQLHEVGHAVGLRHNFEASTDALNYHPEFWAIQELPSDLNAAISATSNDEYRASLEHCVDEQARLQDEIDSDYVVTTQQCLGQNQFMFSTIMEYNGHWTADFGGLGKYDYQAIKFGYAQLMETFGAPTTDRDEETTAKEIYYNDWRDIPTDIVDGVANLTNRNYEKWEWDFASANSKPPMNTVPYRFCTDTYMTPTCNRWDYGPDTRTNASYQEYGYYQRYFFTHFARDRLWTIGSGWTGAINQDSRVMADYTQKMRWFTYNGATDPNFTPDTYIYQDYLATTQAGLNHLSRVLSHSGSGQYVTLPQGMRSYFTMDDPETSDRLATGKIMGTYQDQRSCAQQVLVEGSAVVDEFGNNIWVPTAPLEGQNFTNVPLGDGRPFAIGSLNTDSEEWVINYVGTYYTKDMAIQYLTNQAAWFPRTEFEANPRMFNIGWYTLFPEHVGRIVNNFVTEKFADLGPVVDADGKTHLREILDTDTGAIKEYDDTHSVIIPSIAFNNQYYAAVYSMAWLSNSLDASYDMMNAYTVAVEGAGDDIGAFDTVDADKLVEFVHPDTGMRIRAIDPQTNIEPIGADLVRRANLLKQRYEILDECVTGARDPNATPYCQCVNSFSENGAGQLVCSDFVLTDVGDPGCAEYDLVNRRDRAREGMDDMVDFIDDVRFVKNMLNN